MLDNIINFLISKKENEQAMQLLDVMYKHAFSFEEYDDLARILFKLKEYEKSITPTLDAYLVSYTNEQRWTSRYNLINVYNHANYPELAMKYIKQALASIENDVDVLLEKAYSYFLLNQKDEAEEILQNVLDNAKDLSEEYKTKILFNLGTYYLYRDQFQKGMRLFLLEGAKLDYWQNSTLPFEFWDGKISKGKTIILFSEAGIGDEIINVRFMKHLKELGMNPIWFTDRKDWVEIFNRNGFRATNNIIELKEINPEELLWTYPMRLPIYLNLQYKDLWYGPYLTSSEEYDKKYEWMKSDKLKIGIRWQGNKEYDQDLHRSLPVSMLYESLKDIDAEFYSLQRDEGVEEIKDFPSLIDMQDHMKNYEDTLSIINNLDVVITSCTSIAHASAAMGKRTIIITPISAYYTWSHSTEQSPWYGDNVTLLRQQRPRVWDEPLKQLQNIFR